ncbi:MAG: hypothetical protein FJ303_04295 [Planctomycetes bacterium]|nr:hypothetical protein [Planctomycetota bacterium]
MPKTPAQIDFTVAIESYHRGDWTLQQLRAYARGAKLSPAAADAVRAAIEVGAALRRRAKREQVNSTNSAPIETIPIELSPLARKYQRDVMAAGATAAAKGKKPLPELYDLCEAEGRWPRKKLHVHRYLTDSWKLVVTLSPHDNVVAVRCGDESMTGSTGMYALDVADRSPTGVLELALRDIAVEFRDRSVVTVVFA